MTQKRKVEDYMKTIYSLSEKGTVRGADIARELKVTKPTVSVSLKALQDEGYLKINEDHTIVLTPKGIGIAREMTDRSNSIYDMLIGLGVEPQIAATDAHNMEHVISRDSFCALISLYEDRTAGSKEHE